METLTSEAMLDQDFWPRLAAAHMGAKDAIAFSRSCKRVHAALALRLVSATPCGEPSEFSHGQWSAPSSQYDAKPWQQVVLHGDTSAVHTVFVRCKWSDQGWGNRKGMLSIVADDGRAPGDSKPWGPAVLAGCEPAPHGLEHLELRVRPAAQEVASLVIWYRVGGGGGHSLRVSDLEVRQLRFTSPADSSLEPGVMEQRLVAREELGTRMGTMNLDR